MKLNKKSIFVFLGLSLLASVMALSTYLLVLLNTLPDMITLEDYQPLLVSRVYDRDDNKIGEFFRENRLLVSYDEVPQYLIDAFLAAEDGTFFEHRGVNFSAILRALIANVRAKKKVQGASTISQQVARSLFLTREKTYTRKIKEIFLTYKMERNFSKKEILWLYLNQIYLGQGAYGVGKAAQIYFRKPVSEITLAEAALLAGLPQAPSRYSPTRNPRAAKLRQRYVLNRMVEDNFITSEEAQAEDQKPVEVYLRKNYKDLTPFFLETVRIMLVKELGEKAVLDEGLQVFTSLDLDKQIEAQKQLKKGLRDLDKRQGYRGPLKNIQDPQAVADFLLEARDELMSSASAKRVLHPDGTFISREPLNLSLLDKDGNPRKVFPDYVEADQIVKAIVTQVDDRWGLVTVRFAESQGLIDLETMKWARKPNPGVPYGYVHVKKPSQALKKGDIIQVRLVSDKFSSQRIDKELKKLKRKEGSKYKRPEDLPNFKTIARVELEQEPIVEGALISFDQNTQELLAMVGGYDFSRSEFNRAYQSVRQTGSAFKALVYSSALDKNYTSASLLLDAPVVFEEAKEKSASDGGTKKAEGDAGDEIEVEKWKPANHSKKFFGDILFHEALSRSLNVPTVKILKDIGVNWVINYARRLGIFSPLNRDFTLALGSSGVTLYEMTKVFSQFGRLGRRISPIIIKKVLDKDGNELLSNVSLDQQFQEEMAALNREFEARRQAYLRYKKGRGAAGAASGQTAEQENSKEQGGSADPSATNESVAQALEKAPQKISKVNPAKEPPFYFENPNQLISPETAYITTSLLQGVIRDSMGTGRRASSLGRPVAGKTGTTDGYYDAWFVGYTPDIATGVWVGFDKEQTLGRGEAGGRAALPIWLEYMKFAHKDVPVRGFSVPPGIVFANIDSESGKLGSATSKKLIRQAFKEGTEPTELSRENELQEETDFYKEELSE